MQFPSSRSASSLSSNSFGTSVSFPAPGSKGSFVSSIDSDQLNETGSIRQTGSGRAAPTHQAEPTPVDHMSHFSYGKAAMFIAGAIIAAFGAVIAASGGIAFGAGVVITAPVGACVCAAGLSMMGITISTHIEDKKIAMLAQNTTATFARQSTYFSEQLRLIRAEQRQAEREHQVNYLKLEQQLKQADQHTSGLITYINTDLQSKLFHSFGRLEQQIETLRQQHLSSISHTIASPGSSSSLQSSPGGGPLPTGTDAWTTTNSILSPLSPSILRPEPEPTSTNSSPLKSF